VADASATGSQHVIIEVFGTSCRRDVARTRVATSGLASPSPDFHAQLHPGTEREIFPTDAPFSSKCPAALCIIGLFLLLATHHSPCTTRHNRNTCLPPCSDGRWADLDFFYPLHCPSRCSSGRAIRASCSSGWLPSLPQAHVCAPMDVGASPASACIRLKPYAPITPRAKAGGRMWKTSLSMTCQTQPSPSANKKARAPCGCGPEIKLWRLRCHYTAAIHA